MVSNLPLVTLLIAAWISSGTATAAASAATAPAGCRTAMASLHRTWPAVNNKSKLLQQQFLSAAAPTAYPQITTPNGLYSSTDASQWTAGFFSSLFFQASLLARWKAPGSTARYRDLGARAASNLGPGVQALGNNHDLGFLIFLPYRMGVAVGAASPVVRRLMLRAAEARFQVFQPRLGRFGGFPTGKKSLPDPTNDVLTIVDDMVNLELMFGAAAATGRCDWFNAAAAHARSMASGHVASNGSVHHKVVWSKLTRKVVTTEIGQGASPTSDWSRGHAWAIYGFTMAQRYMRARNSCAVAHRRANPGALLWVRAAAVRAADSFLRQLPSRLQVPPWDFSVKSTALSDRDSSAAAIAASALVELDGLAKGKGYLRGAARILKALTSPSFLAPAGGKFQALLQHCTLYRLHSSFDTGCIWGDYFLLEGLARAAARCKAL